MDPILALDIVIPESGQGSKVEFITRQVGQAILDGRLQKDVKMPSTRALAHSLKVSRNTIISAYDNLISQGYLDTKKGDGTYVADLPLPAKQNNATSLKERKNLIAPYWQNRHVEYTMPMQPDAKYVFRLGVPDTSRFPFGEWRRHLSKSVRKVENSLALQAGPQGAENLRSAIVTHVSVSRAIACHQSNILVSAGAQQALNLIASILITPGKTKVAMESPGYPMMASVFSAMGVEVIPIPVDKQGLRIDKIPEDVNLVYVTPSHQFPLGVAMSASRRAALIDLAERLDIAIIEDDYDCDFRLSGRPVDALKTQDHHDRVFYVGTFSKNMLPDIKIGYVISPTWAIDALCSAKFQQDWGNSVIQQQALASFISSGDLFRHIRRMRRFYAERYGLVKSLIVQKCRPFLEILPVHTGMHATALLTIPLNAREICAVALSRGVSIRSIEDMSVGGDIQQGLLFGFGCIEPNEISEAITILADVIKTMARQHNL